MAGVATMKQSISSSVTIIRSATRSATIEPTTVPNGACSRRAIYVQRHTSPSRGKTRFSAYVPNIEQQIAMNGGRMPKARNWMRQRAARDMWLNTLMHMASIIHQ